MYYPDVEVWRTQATSFTGMGLVRGVFKTFSIDGRAPETLFATEVTAGTFELLGVRPILGRDFTVSDQRPEAEPVVMLRYDFWEQELGKDPSVVGRAVRLDGELVTVIGVMPPGFSFPEDQRLWTPLVPTPAALERDVFFARYAFGRLAEGASIASARAELETVGSRLAHAFPRTNNGLVPIARPFDEAFIGAGAATLYKAVWGGAGLVLAIVWCNLSGLLLTRALSRAREMSVRVALGASRWRTSRQLLVEGLVCASFGGVLGWWMARAIVRVYRTQIGFGAARVLDYTMDARVLAYVAGISLGTGVVVGLAAAFRLATLDVNGALKDGGRGVTAGRRSGRVANLLVTAEMAFAVVLLAGAGVMIRSVLHVYAANPGIDAANVLSMSMYVPPERYPDADARITFYQRLDERLRALAGVQAVGLGAVAPTERAARSEYEVADAPIADEQSRPVVADIAVSPGYFRTLGAQVVAGRAFDAFDGPSRPPVAVVNQQFARQNWPDEAALGKRVRLFRQGTPQAWLTVVGIVSNIVQNDATRQSFEPLLYVPYEQRPQPNMFVFARVRVAPESFAPAFARAVYTLDPRLPVPALMPLSERFARAYAFERNMMVLFLTFALVALLLACLGLYATVAHSVSARTHEIGVRAAMGAAARDIWRLVFRKGLLPVAAGLGIGLVAAGAVNRVVETQLVGVTPTDPAVLVTVCVVLVAAAAIGCLFPARRAMRVDPLVALKHE